MRPRVIRMFSLVLGLAFVSAASVAACPYCKTAAVGLAEASSTASTDGETTRYGITGGMDFASGYYFRGYRQVDPGLAWQSNLSVFAERRWSNGVIARPYVAGFYSANYGDPVNMADPADLAAMNQGLPHDHARHVERNTGGVNMADMSDVMLGVAGTWRGLAWDARYAYYTTNPTQRSPVNELGARVSVDLLADWSGGEPVRPFSLRPAAGVFYELDDRDSTADTYIELGLEPAWKGMVLGQPAGVGVPLTWGLSPNGYYRDNFGQDATLGFFSVALVGSIELPLPKLGGQWYLNGSVQFLRLVAPSVRDVAGGDQNAVVGKIGISFAY